MTDSHGGTDERRCKGGTAKEKGLRKSLLLGLILCEPMRWVAGEEGGGDKSQRGLGP